MYIYKGKNSIVDISLGDYEHKIYPVKRENIKDINLETENIKLNFEAPLDSNTKIGDLIVNIGDEELMEIEILINNNIERKGIKEYIFKCLDSII